MSSLFSAGGSFVHNISIRLRDYKYDGHFHREQSVRNLVRRRSSILSPFCKSSRKKKHTEGEGTDQRVYPLSPNNHSTNNYNNNNRTSFGSNNNSIMSNNSNSNSERRKNRRKVSFSSNGSSSEFIKYSDIRKRAIQIFHTDEGDRHKDTPHLTGSSIHHNKYDNDDSSTYSENFPHRHHHLNNNHHSPYYRQNHHHPNRKEKPSCTSPLFCLNYIPILHPNSKFRRTFDLFNVLWVLYLVFAIPFEVAFVWYPYNKFKYAFHMFLDVWFGIDILLNFRTGYITHGTIVMNPEKIRRNYFTSWFIIDLLGTVPFELALNIKSNERKSLKLIKYIKIPKLMRISRLMKFMFMHKYIYGVFQTFFLLFTLLHICSCTWIAVLNPCDEYNTYYNSDDIDSASSYLSQEDTLSTVSSSTIPDDIMCHESNISSMYIEAIHMTSVMMLGVSGTEIIGGHTILDSLISRKEEEKYIDGETIIGRDKLSLYIVSTIFAIVGVFMIALLIGELGVYLIGTNQGSAAFQRQSDRVKYEMEYYGLPDDLQMQVKAYYKYVWIHQKQYDDKIALLSDNQMSTDLQRKLALHLFKDVVSHISFFSELNDILLGDICLSLRTRIFLPNDMIIFKGDKGKELFIIAKGVVEVLRDDLPPGKIRDSTPPIFLRNGSFFGEIALLMEVRRTCSVQARTVCEVSILEQTAFDAILRENPDFAKRMNELVVARQLDKHIAKRAAAEVGTTRSTSDTNKSQDTKNNQGKSESDYNEKHSEISDFEVSKKDLKLAVTEVEKNIRQGLERRGNYTYYNYDYSPYGSRTRSKSLPANKIDYESMSESQDMQNSMFHNQEGATTSNDFNNGIKTKELPLYMQRNNRPLLEKEGKAVANKSNNNHHVSFECIPNGRQNENKLPNSVSNIFDDIARRSTRLPYKFSDKDLDQMEEARKRTRRKKEVSCSDGSGNNDEFDHCSTISSPTSSIEEEEDDDDVINVYDDNDHDESRKCKNEFSMDTERRASIDLQDENGNNENRGLKRDQNKNEITEEDSDTDNDDDDDEEEDEEALRAIGGFSPRHTTLDLRKVRASILMSGRDSGGLSTELLLNAAKNQNFNDESKHLDMQKIESRLNTQNKCLKKILKKLDIVDIEEETEEKIHSIESEDIKCEVYNLQEMQDDAKKDGNFSEQQHEPDDTMAKIAR